MGHLINECRTRQNSTQNNQNLQRPNFRRPPSRNTNPRSFQQPGPSQRPSQSQKQYSQNQLQQNRPAIIRPSPSSNNQRPSAIQPNPNYRPNNQNLFHMNYQQTEDQYHYNDQPQGDYSTSSSEPTFDYQQDYYIDDSQTIILIIAKTHMKQRMLSNKTNIIISQSCPQHFYNQNFHLDPIQGDPPNNFQQEFQDQDIAQLQTQIQTMNLDNFDPTLNFPEQQFI
ncbi:hypothetical protein JTB14_008041 [Gonioctena quinquepunctata]|nr:hypothetical protein JTB14_008041 [Gonioctena quinquepunctata]